ncbi:hypothetical protein H5S09_10555 [Limosilactobacillus sp. STM2_1]|uniref:Glycosyl-4,4'-diaponeurosporenoate acyltransferase n=1 Tax=Limosilactobacillus rudii TaxID=2759755 RepID=A0A7W3UNL3_9LACO|nr:hypothetical protein [Limosilactobacillus rudii]MBB1080339.1 hypothetical protein [Limosilactobacillus rudii]MBB1098365.1 hypothetical protein [Limosilactobacillus rudii]MCD7135373.1 hypothetical protein [Limosilactobacillus rudii]
MENFMKQVTVWSGLGLLLIVGINLLFSSQFLLELAITLLVIFYHFTMRLVVGNVLEPHLKLTDTSWWFKVRLWEQHLYRLLKVKKWKRLLPTYAPAKYNLQQHSLTQIGHTMILAEADHEIMFLLSYLPLILIIPFGAPVIFICTSIIASLIEVPFVILQRYNRYRLLKLLHRQVSRRKKNLSE